MLRQGAERAGATDSGAHGVAAILPTMPRAPSAGPQGTAMSRIPTRAATTGISRRA